MFYHLNPINKGWYLDIGCGTGNYTSKLHTKETKFIGIDPSQKMLNKAQESFPNILWKLGTAEDIPLENESVEGVVGTLTLHHWNDLEKGFSELFRVMRNYTNIVFFTATPEQMKGYWLNHYFPKMMNDSIKQMPSLDDVKFAMNQVGFNTEHTENYFIKPDLQDKFLYCGKHNPELYFNENIRHGISSFSSLANIKEIESGLNKLRHDINREKIYDIIKSYENGHSKNRRKK